MKRLYLDYAATTPVREEVLAAMLPYFSERAFNASSVHAEGRAAKAALDNARERVAACLNCKFKEIVFTGGGSEADNLAILGALRAAPRDRRTLVSLATEHHAVLHALDAAADEGSSNRVVRVQHTGLVDEEAFAAALDDSVLLTSVMYVNNELGVVQPIRKLAGLTHGCGALFHTDAVQAGAYLDLDVEALGVDFLSLGAHKFYGPKGIGVLYVREGTPVRPLVFGGSQESGKRAGTENVAAAVGLAVALDLAVREREAAAERVTRLRQSFEDALLARITDTRVNGAGAPRAPHIANVSFSGVESEQLLLRLDLDGVAVSAGSACASGVIEPSHVVAALALEPKWQRGVVRFSFGRTTTLEDVERAAHIVDRAVADLRAVSACF